MSGNNRYSTADDKELDDLLESALEDFDKNKNEPNSDSQPAEHPDPPTEQLWKDEFISIQAKLFEEKMATLFGDGGNAALDTDQISLGFQRIAEAAAMAIKSDVATVPENTDPLFSQSITEALKGLSEGRENLQTPFSSEDMASMFGNIDLNESGDNNAFLPFMQNMMQSLLSAEVLLPSLKDLVEKYPKWLEDNLNTISAEDKGRYTKQLELMQQVCEELEKEKSDDSSDIKKKRFQTVLEGMQKMQDLGQPPADLVGDLGSNIDPSAFNDPSQCATS